MDLRKSSSPGTPAPYGQACANCAQSKCKCFTRRTGGPCERCRRLNKECRPAETVRRRSSRKPAISRTARLEEKLDGLVSLIKAGAQSGGLIPSSRATTAMDDSTPGGTFDNVQMLTPATDDSTGSPYNLSPSGFDNTGSELSPVKAEEYLTNFQTYKSKYFPLIYIPSTTTASQLRQERPLLWLCIMTVGSKSTSQQQVLGSKIRETIAREMVVQSEKNIDLLLGILIFIWWAHFQIQSKPFLTVFTQLAMSLVFDHGLNKPVPKDMKALPCLKGNYSRAPTPRTNEERRAVLGCFLITSVISLFIQKIDALRWTSHMDECLQVLDEAKECLTDGILVQQVRLQLIAEKMAQGTWHDGALESTKHTSELPSLHFQSLHSQFQNIKIQILAGTQADAEEVLLHLYSVELDIALSPTFLLTNQLTLQQRNSINAALESIKSWFDVFFIVPPAAYIGFPFSIWSQLLRCLVTLSRLITLDDPSWDENGVWETVDVVLVFDRVINNLEQVATLAGLDNSDSPEGDPFSRAAQMFRALRHSLETRPDPDDLSTIPLPQNINEMFPPDAFPIELLDDDWLMDLLLSPNY